MVKRQGVKPHRITQSGEFSIGTIGDFCTGSDNDVLVATIGENSVYSAQLSADTYDVSQLAFIQNQFNDAGPTSFPRISASGHVQQVCTNLQFMLDGVKEAFFPREFLWPSNQIFNSSVIQTGSSSRFITAEWLMPVLDAKGGKTVGSNIGFQIIFTEDFIHALAAKDDIARVRDILEDYIENAIFREYARILQERVQTPYQLMFGSEFLLAV